MNWLHRCNVQRTQTCAHSHAYNALLHKFDHKFIVTLTHTHTFWVNWKYEMGRKKSEHTCSFNESVQRHKRKHDSRTNSTSNRVLVLVKLVLFFVLFFSSSNVHCLVSLAVRESSIYRFSVFGSIQSWNYIFINIDYEHYYQASGVVFTIAAAVAAIWSFDIDLAFVPINWNRNLFSIILFLLLVFSYETLFKSNWHRPSADAHRCAY